MHVQYAMALKWLNMKAKNEGGVNALARKLGVPPATLYRVLKGDSPPAADRLISWLEQLGASLSFPDEQMEHFELIFKVKAQAGSGDVLLTSCEREGVYAFRSDFLQREGICVERSILLDVSGQSMEPLIRHRDTILVDQSSRALCDGEIFLVGLGKELLVKRVQRIPRGWLLHSENEIFRDIHVEEKDLCSGAFRVYGQVRWFGRVL